MYTGRVFMCNKKNGNKVTENTNIDKKECTPNISQINIAALTLTPTLYKGKKV